MKAFSYLVLPFLFIIQLGCASHGSNNPVDVPVRLDNPTQEIASTLQSNSHVWGLWQVNFSEDHLSAEIKPLRSVDMHLNATEFLENQPLAKCLTIDSISILNSGALEVAITLWHPFPGNYNLTGFDVRGVVITDSDYYFPENNKNIAWDNGLRMVDLDGYTNLFNPADYPESETVPSLFTYYSGDMASGGPLTSTLNPYFAYSKDLPRRAFLPGTKETKSIRFYPPVGPFALGYAVTACWVPPGMQVTNPVNQFPPEANCQEPYKVEAQVWPGITPEIGSTSKLNVKVYDWQGLETVEEVRCECPSLFSGEKVMEYGYSDDEGHIYTVDISNDHCAERSNWPLLVRVNDVGVDPNMGSLAAWSIVPVNISEGWIDVWGKPETDYQARARSCGVAVDSQGNSYVVGECQYSNDFDPGPGAHYFYSNGGHAYISKFDSRGQLIWNVRWHCKGPSQPEGIAVDSLNNIYIGGYFHGECDFDPGDSEFVVEPVSSTQDAYLLKLNSSGAFQWVRTWSSLHPLEPGPQCNVQSVSADSDGSILATGLCEGDVDLDPGPGVAPHSAGQEFDAYVIKFSSDGDYIWSRAFGGDYDLHTCYISSDNNNYYLSGDFKGSIDFDPGPGMDYHTSNGKTDVFVSKFNIDGEYQYCLTWGNTENDVTAEVACSSNDDIFCTGAFSGTVDFDPGASVFELNSINSRSTFLVKFSNNGVFQNAVRWHGADYIVPDSITVLNSEFVYVGGYFKLWADLDPTLFEEIFISNGMGDSFVSIFDTQCNYIKGFTYGGQYKNDIQGMTISDQGFLYITSDFGTTNTAYADETIDLDPGSRLQEYTTDLSVNSYLLKLYPDGTL